MKSYTDIKQSRKLAEFLSIKSADMYYPYEGISTCPNIEDGFANVNSVPCWSLGALLNILPNGYVMVKNYHGLYFVESRDHKKSTNIFNNPVDALYELILKLKEKNLL